MTNAPFLSRAILVCLLLTLSGLVTSCASPKPITATADDGTFAGELRTTTYTIAAHERIIVKNDLHIIAEEHVLILGEFVGHNGATIEITAPSIIIHGTIQAGDGNDREGVLEHGQDGGSIVLNSPQIDLTGAALHAGRGGNAGPAGNGGSGGDIMLNDAAQVIGTGANLVAGEGGEGGAGIHGHGDAALDGGAGGAGGSAGGGTRQYRAPGKAG